ncbi:Innexin family-containing protein [Strongyloides ratti]|uniref:Innexin n=1 Tax=Strongyloides ratti TaxID=34506 RepID=A0A090L079_STRRB|nr:Innexin family-containing protein [Strongyloides ratti]CEF60894.1 Innexin family-containing protein [Strongyloides ratti]
MPVPTTRPSPHADPLRSRTRGKDIPNLNDNLKTGNTISAPTTPSPYNLPRLSRHFNQEKTFDNVTKEEHKNKLPRSYSLSPGANLWKVFKRNKLIPTDNIFFGSEYHTISNKHIYYRSNHQNRNKLVNKPLYKRRWLQRRGNTRGDSHYQQAAVLEVGAMVLQNMFSALSFLHYRKDDDFVDRLSYFYTSSFLIMMAVLVSFKQFGGRPLECWVPAQFTASWEAYTEMYCWAQNTYWVPIDQEIPEDIAEREYRQISYYQWVPFFLLIEAFLYYIPCLMWRLMSDKSGIRMNDIVQMATEKENIEPEYRLRTIESLARHIEAALRYQHTATSRTQYTLHRVFKCFNMRYYESYVTGLYLATKIFYVTNIMVNLILVNKFLETDEYNIYGIGVLRDLLFGRTWMESGNFPRVTLCDFEVRVLGNTQRHSVQCVLVINIFNEKIFILIWLWFSLLLVATTFDALYWFNVSIFHRDRLRFVLRHLELTSDPDKPELFRKEKRKQVEHFVKTYIKVDGVLVLRMIALHAGVMYCTEITDALWKRYLSQRPENLIDEDSSLIHFARTQSIRKRQGSPGSRDPSLSPHRTTSHQKLSRFLSNRSTGSIRIHRSKDNKNQGTTIPLSEVLTTQTQPPPPTISKPTIVTITSPSRAESPDRGHLSTRISTKSSPSKLNSNTNSGHAL